MDDEDVETLEKAESGRWGFLRSALRKNKNGSKVQKAIDNMLATNILLTSSIHDQTQTITDLSSDNGRYEAELSFQEKRINSLMNEKRVLEEQIERTKTDMCRTRRNLETTQNEMRIVSYQKSDMKANYDRLTIDNDQLQQTKRDLQGQLIKLQSKFDRLRADYDGTLIDNSSLKMQLDEIKKRLMIGTFASKILTEDKKRLEETLQQKDADIAQIHDEKMQIVNFFNAQGRRNLTDDATQVSVITAAGSVDRDIEKLKTKLLDAECRLYRRSYLVQELYSIIRSYDPLFCIHGNPYLRGYADDEDTVHFS